MEDIWRYPENLKKKEGDIWRYSENLRRIIIIWMCGVARKDRNTSKNLRQRVGYSKCLCDKVHQEGLRWLGHERKMTGFQRVEIWQLLDKEENVGRG